MPLKRTGLQTIDLPLRPAVCASAAFVGKKEGEGPLGALFDHVAQDELYGQDTFELAEKRLYLDAIRKAIQKGGLKPENVQFLLGGDLLNQIITASFSARELGIPFIGLYGACSTMAESLAMAGCFVEGNLARRCLAVTSSHFCSAERQFRFPLEYGGQRPPSAQWTATAAGACVVGEGWGPCIREVTFGKICDLGIKDMNNMGAAMAPAAADTIWNYFQDTQSAPSDFDCIFTGDLGVIGSSLLYQLLSEKGLDISQKHQDCGLLLFDRRKQDVGAGGSGCGCSASVFCGYILKKLREGQMKEILFLATGALLSTTSVQQGGAIPGIAHLLHISHQKTVS